MGKGTPVAWVDFADISCSMSAMNLYQGYQAPSGSRMRLEFAKSRMGSMQVSESRRLLIITVLVKHGPGPSHVKKRLTWATFLQCDFSRSRALLGPVFDEDRNNVSARVVGRI